MSASSPWRLLSFNFIFLFLVSQSCCLEIVKRAEIFRCYSDLFKFNETLQDVTTKLEYAKSSGSDKLPIFKNLSKIADQYYKSIEQCINSQCYVKKKVECEENEQFECTEGPGSWFVKDCQPPLIHLNKITCGVQCDDNLESKEDKQLCMKKNHG